jgi:hypothetical protein
MAKMNLPKINIPKKMVIPLALAVILLLVVVVVLAVAVGGSNEAEETSSEAVLTQAMETALARMTFTPTVLVSPTMTWTPLPSVTPSLTPLSSPTRTSAPAQPPASGTGCDVAGFVADVTIPDGTQLNPGQSFKKVWELRNDGTCTWNSSYQVVFYSGAQMSGTSPQQLTAGTVAPGQTVQIAIDMVAPAQEGRHIGNWVLRNAQGATFGIGGASPFYVDITVTGSGVVGSPTPTATTGGAAATATATATQQQAATSTKAPTNTEAPKPTDTVPAGTPYP